VNPQPPAATTGKTGVLIASAGYLEYAYKPLIRCASPSVEIFWQYPQ